MESSLKIYFVLLCGISAVTSFSWKNCGKSTDPIKIIELEIDSEPDDTFFISGKTEVTKNITSPIKAKLEVFKEGWNGWDLIDCINGVGSCTYDNLCEMSPYKNDTTCPPEFDKNGLPCRCPLLQGQYEAKDFSLQMDIPDIIKGRQYKIKALFSRNGEQLLCLEVIIDL